MSAGYSPGGRLERLRPAAYLAFASTATAALLLWLSAHVIHVLLLGFGGVLLALFLTGIGKWLSEHTRLPEKAGTAIGFFAIAGAGAAAASWTAPRIAHQADVLYRTLPQAIDRIEADIRQYSWGERSSSGSPT